MASLRRRSPRLSYSVELRQVPYKHAAIMLTLLRATLIRESILLVWQANLPFVLSDSAYSVFAAYSSISVNAAGTWKTKSSDT